MRYFYPKLLISDYIKDKVKLLPINKDDLFKYLKSLTKEKISWNYKGYVSYEKKRFNFDKRIWKSKKKFKICALCDSTKNIHRHHIIPLGIGGINMAINLIALCKSCHEKVHNNTPIKDTKEKKIKTILRKNLLKNV